MSRTEQITEDAEAIPSDQRGTGPLTPTPVEAPKLRRPPTKVRGTITIRDPERTIRLVELEALLKGAEITWPDQPPTGPPGLAVTTWRDG